MVLILWQGFVGPQLGMQFDLFWPLSAYISLPAWINFYTCASQQEYNNRNNLLMFQVDISQKFAGFPVKDRHPQVADLGCRYEMAKAGTLW